MKNEFRLKIELGNAAMSSGEAVARALDDIAKKLRAGKEEGVIHDTNGNRVGEWDFKLTKEYREGAE